MLGARLVPAALALCLSLLLVPMAAAAEHGLPAPDGGPLDGHGESVAIDGFRAVVGAPGNGGAGAVFVYERTHVDGWTRTAKLTASNGSVGDRFGGAVAVDGDIIAVGAEMAGGGGAVYMFRRDDATGLWSQVQKLGATTYDGSFPGERFGASVALDQDGYAVVVGAPGTSMDQSGRVYVFHSGKYAQGPWWMRTDVFDGPQPGSGFGESVDIHARTIAVGAPRNEAPWFHPTGGSADKGAVFLYAADGGNGWGTNYYTGFPSPRMTSTLSDGDAFGTSVSLSGPLLLVGAPATDVAGVSDQGAAYVFEYVEEHDRPGIYRWSERAKLTAADGAAGDRLGFSVGLHGPTAVAGAPFAEVDGAPDAGAAYAFGRYDGWTQTRKDTTAGSGADHRFGHSVAVNGIAELAGAPNPAGAGGAHAFGDTQDVDPPQTSITTSEPRLTNDPTGDFKFAASEAAEYRCSVDGGDLHSCDATFSTGELGEGTHDLRVHAIDEWGNQDPTPATATWVVDLTKPVVDISGPASVLTTAAEWTISGTASDGSGIEKLTWDLGGSTPKPLEGTTSFSLVVSLPRDGGYYSVTATDAAGNVGKDTILISRDNFVPYVRIDGPSMIGEHHTTAARIAVYGVARDGHGIVSMGWRSSTGASGALARTGEQWRIDSLELVEGENVITISATDGAGNVGTATLKILRDNTAPVIAITAPTSDSSLTTTASSIALSGTARDDGTPLGGVSWVNSAGGSGRATGLATWTVPSIPLSAGVNTITVRATDSVGNTSTDTITVIRDNTLPQTTLTASEADPTTDSTGDFEFSSDEAGTFQCSVDGGAFSACASPYATPALADGSHSLQVRAVDAAGNADATPATHSWTVVTKAPQATARPAVSGSTSVGDRLTSGTGGWSGLVSGYQYRWKRCAATCRTIAGTADADDGDSTYTLTAADAGHSLFATVTATNAAGSASAASTRTATVGAPLSTGRPTVSGTALSGNVLTASTGTWSPAAERHDHRWQRCAVACTSISGIADAEDGDSTYTLTSADAGHTIRSVVTATNAAGSTTAYSPRTTVVDLPINTLPPAITGTKQTGHTLTATTGKWTPQIDTYAYRWRRCTGTTAATCTDITGTPEGDNTYTLTAADTGHYIRVTVTATNRAGSTTAGASATGKIL